MIGIKGQVLAATENILLLREKDKEGNRTGEEKEHKNVNIQLLCTDSLDPKKQFVAICSTFDPSSDFKLPKSGESFSCYCRKVEIIKGVVSVNF